jgi:hypothetical protein
VAFIIYCLPRSRSAWMAHFLNYPFARPLQPVAHDVATLCRSVEGFVHAYKEEGMWGSVEIGGIIAWQLIHKELPDLKVVVVRRPLQEVYDSIVMQGCQGNLTYLAELNAMLDLIGAQKGVYTINSSDLDAPVTGKWLFEYCLELEFDFDWWYSLSQLNIQVKLDEVAAISDELGNRHDMFQADVLNRMSEVNKCLH